MTIVASFLVFIAAFAASAMVFAFTLAPALPRIAALLRGEEDPVFAARPVLVMRERRVMPRVAMVRPARVARAAA